MGVSVKGESISPDLSPVSSGGSPRVIIGISDSVPPPSLPESELVGPMPGPVVEAKGPQTMPSFTKTLIETYVPSFSDPDPEPEAAPVVDAKVKTAPTAIVEEVEAAPAEAASAVVVEEEAPKGVDLTRTLVHGSLIDDDAPKPIEGALLPHAKDRLEELRLRKEGRERLKEKRAVAEAAVRLDAPSTDPDEVSVPPAGDLEVEDHSFFERGEQEAIAESQRIVQAHAAVFALEADAFIPEKARRKSEPHIVRRRQKLAGYVRVAVASAAVLCLAAVGRNAMHNPTKATTPVQATHVEMSSPPPPAAVTEAPAPAPVEVKAADPVAAPAASAIVAEDAKPAEVTGDAKEELKKSRTALERRKIPDAIEAGEKSVTLDPTDGEAWLILGAAYQEKGDLVNAHRCYASCIKEGKTGPRLECQKMLR